LKSYEFKKDEAFIKGKVIKLGDNIDTDIIYPGKYLSLLSPDEIKKHALEGVDPSFPLRIRPNDVIVAGKNFGCGSSRSQAVTCLKYAGISAIVAVSFARIFFRNSINQGLPVIVSRDAYQKLDDRAPIYIDLLKGIIKSNKTVINFSPLPDFLLNIILQGGLVPYTKEILKGNINK